MAAPKITSITNAPADGEQITVGLAAAPTGDLAFYASPVAGILGVAVTATGGPTSYVVRLRDDPTVVRQPWFITARDDAGDSQQRAVWLCYGTNKPWGEQIESGLQEILKENKEALDTSMQVWWGDTKWPDGSRIEVSKILRGKPVAESDEKLTVVSVRVNRLGRMDFYGVPYGMEVPVHGMVYGYIVHDGRKNLENLAEALGEGVLGVLNRLRFLELELPCGLSLRKAYCSALDTNEDMDPNVGGWVAAFQAEWEAVLEYGEE